MESPPDSDAVNILPPENLPPPSHVPVAETPRVFDQRQKLAIVMELIKSGEPTSVIAARHGILPRLLRSWSNTHNARAFEVIKKEQAEAVNPKPPPKAPAPSKKRRFDFAPKPEAMKAEAVHRVLNGERAIDVARHFGISPKVVRNWYEKQTGKKLIQGELIKESEKPMEKAKGDNGNKVRRRVFSDKEKILYAVRFRKLKLSLKEGAKQLGVSVSALKRWLSDFEKIEPHRRSGAVRGAMSTTQLEEGIKLATLKRIAAGERPSVLARELKVHSSSLKNWWAKHRPKEPWPKQPTTRPKGSTSPIKARNIMDTRAIDAIKQVENGELISDVAMRLEVGAGTVRNWWRALKGSDNWPKQYGVKQIGGHRPTGKRNGPQKKTLQRMAVREALISNGEVIAAQELSAENVTHANGHAQPISTGKAVHDATIFLQLARDEFQKAVKAGKLRVDDPTMLLPMLALHTLSK